MGTAFILIKTVPGMERDVYLTLSDLDPVWGSTARNIKFKFTGANSNKIYLFTNSLTSTTDKYTTTNVQYPSISVKSHFY